MRADSNESAAPVLEVRGIHKTFGHGGIFERRQPVVAARDVSFRVRRGEAVALVGQSGSGKTTLARLVLRLETPDGGEIRLDGENVLEREPRGASLHYRGRVQMVFQDPFGSLNPVHDVAHHLIRPLLRHRRATRANARTKALELLRTVGLEPAEEFIARRPYELSGGQRQRVAVARALAVDPDVLVADEPTSMLDVSIRLDILQLFARLKRDRRLAILLITHDLASARYLADRILVLYEGRVVEDGPTASVIERPQHPYTRQLLAAIADAGESGGADTMDPQTPTDPGAAWEGCPFRLRCPEAMEVCATADPEPRRADGRDVRCHLYPGAPDTGPAA